MNQLILIERYRPSSFFWINLEKNKKISELSVEEVLNKYGGFEGELIAYFPIEENKTDLKKMMDECLKIKNNKNYYMLYVISDSEILAASLKEKTIQIGFDVGVCEEEKTIYSSIFNEILFGHLDELIAYKRKLNKNLLFPSKSLAEDYIKLHNELSVQGKGVEDYEKMTIYEIRKSANLGISEF